jgi:type IV fimbrial biogenesis protein FimT
MSLSTRRSKGFTLLELMVTMTIAAILIAVGVPGLTTFIANNRMVSQVNTMVGMLNAARMESIAQRRTVTVCGSSDGTSCDGTWSSNWIAFIDQNGNGAINTTTPPAATDDVVIRTAQVNNRLTVAVLGNSGAATLQFNPQGFAVNASSTIRFCDGRGDTYARGAILLASGRVAIAIDTNSTKDDIVNGHDNANLSCS